MTANQSFIAAMATLVAWAAALYGVARGFEWWEARQRAKGKQKP